MYWKYYQKKKVLLSIRDFNDDQQLIKSYFLIRGRKKRIILQAMKWYLILFNIEEDYQLVDLSSYENRYFYWAGIMEKIGFGQVSIYLNKRASSILYKNYKKNHYKNIQYQNKLESKIPLIKKIEQSEMKEVIIIIYHCYGAAHSSVLSAAIHLGYLPEDRIPGIREILKIPYFDKSSSKEIGIPFFYGSDNSGNKIYCQGMGGLDRVIKDLLKDVLRECHIPEERVITVNTLKNVNILVRIGGFLSRKLGLVFPGRLIVAFGLKLVYRRFIKTVSSVKLNIC